MTEFSTLTVRQLRALLFDQDQDALVVFSADYGDYHHTEQAFPIEGYFEEREVRDEPGYSNSGYALVDEERVKDDEDEEDNLPTVLVIR